jgi:hypothetical protein
MNKICTNIDQSKKLVELGIDVKTADMYWWDSSKRYYIEAMDDGDFNEAEGHIPAWSLSALLNLMPSYLFEFERGIDLNIYPDLNGKGWHCIYMPNNIYNMPKDKFRQITSNDNPLDAAYEMVVWLLENNYINNKKL